MKIYRPYIYNMLSSAVVLMASSKWYGKLISVSFGSALKKSTL